MAARCETVLNTTMAEMDTYHSQKLEDFRSLMTDHLDGEIALYEQVRECPHFGSISFILSPGLADPPAPTHSAQRIRRASIQ